MTKDIQQPNDVQQNVQEPEFNNLQDDNNMANSRGMDFLLDIPVELTVQLGTTKMLIKDLLQLGAATNLQ